MYLNDNDNNYKKKKYIFDFLTHALEQQRYWKSETGWREGRTLI